MPPAPRSSALSRSLFPFHSPKLPPEVCEVIISFVDKDTNHYSHPRRLEESTKTLSSCALVCRSWITKARIHLFRSVAVDNTSASKFAAVITTSRTLGSYVQRVVLFCKEPTEELESTRSTSSKHHEWIYGFLNEVVPLLPKLTSFEYSGVPELHPRFYIGPPRMPSLTSLTLSFVETASIGDIFHLIGSYKSLKELCLIYGEWGQVSNHHYRFGQRWGCNLRVLSVIQDYLCGILYIFQWLSQLGTSCSLEHLFLEIQTSQYDGDEKAILNLLSIPEHMAMGWASNLKTLSVTLWPDTRYEQDHPCTLLPVGECTEQLADLSRT